MIVSPKTETGVAREDLQPNGSVIDGFSAWAIPIMDSLSPEAELGLMLKETRGAGQTLGSGPQQLIVSFVSEMVENVEWQDRSSR